MATGSHGIRFQYDYTHDTTGPPTAVTNAAPRWVRLTRSGDTITGYTSADGHRWTEVGSTRLTGLPAAVQAGIFVTSPTDFRAATGYPTRATAAFDHITVNGPRPPRTRGSARTSAPPRPPSTRRSGPAATTKSALRRGQRLG